MENYKKKVNQRITHEQELIGLRKDKKTSNTVSKRGF
jgi:hypothetical protein